MKIAYIGYIIVALIILFATFVRFFNFQFFDERDAKNLLAGLSIGLLIKVITLRRRVYKSEKKEI